MSDAYTASGVNIAEGDRVVRNIQQSVTSTWNSNVISQFGDFAGMYDWNGGTLVASTDGVGTKTIAVLQTLPEKKGYQSLGHDIVNHCVNDILVKGAEPLFFLDYIASSVLNADHVVWFVEGVAKACREAGCVLLGGETAEMPDVYKDHIDIVGTIVGSIKPERLINGPANIRNLDVIIGLKSSGPHTNGYSLIRKLIPNLYPEDVAPHRSYLSDVNKIYDTGVNIHGLCHITGGGWWGNIKRVLPNNFSVCLSIPRPDEGSIFTRVQKAGYVSDREMSEVFNMGYGLLIFVDPRDTERVHTLFDSDYVQLLGTVQANLPPIIGYYDK